MVAPSTDTQDILKALASLEKTVARLLPGTPFDQTVMISATTPYVLDYRDRKYVYCYSKNALILTLGDAGTIAVAANAWTNLNFQPGLFIYAQSQVANVPLYILQTDEPPETAGALALAKSSTGTPSSVASANSDTTILAANANRLGATIYNDSTQILYLLLAVGTSSTTNYSVQVPSQGYFELPGPYLYTGILKGIWAAANGNARVTEWT